MFTITNTPKGRNELKSFFKNKSQLSETHFAQLIDSVLNKRDDCFHGVWQKGRTYKKGDVVYYAQTLWEMTADQEICAQKDEDSPGNSSNWTSRLIKLEQQVEKLETDLKGLQKEFTDCQKEFNNFKQQVAKYFSLLTLGLGFIFMWFLIGAISHLFSHTG